MKHGVALLLIKLQSLEAEGFQLSELTTSLLCFAFSCVQQVSA